MDHDRIGMEYGIVLNQEESKKFLNFLIKNFNLDIKKDDIDFNGFFKIKSIITEINQNDSLPFISKIHYFFEETDEISDPFKIKSASLILIPFVDDGKNTGFGIWWSDKFIESVNCYCIDYSKFNLNNSRHLIYLLESIGISNLSSRFNYYTITSKEEVKVYYNELASRRKKF